MNRAALVLALGVVASSSACNGSGGTHAASAAAGSVAAAVSGSKGVRSPGSVAPTGSFVAPVPTSVAAVGSEWTVLVYVNANNNLEAPLLAGINALETVGSTERVTVLVEVETATIPFGTPSDHLAKRFKIEKDSDPTMVSSPTLAYLGDVDGTAPDEIARFVSWGRQRFPSQRYALVLADHGGSWTGYGEDDSHGTVGDYRKLADLVAGAGRALGQRFDLFGFETCLGAGIEVQMLLANVARVGVACEESVPSGWNWSQGLAALVQQPTMEAADLGKTLVQDTSTSRFTTGVSPDQPTEQGNDSFQMSAIDLGKVPAVVDAVGRFVRGHRGDLATLAPTIGAARLRSLSFWKQDDRANDGFLVDLADLAAHLAPAIPDPALADIQSSVAAAVLGQTKALLRDRATGISVWFPTLGALPQGPGTTPDDPGFGAGLYQDTAFAKETGWDQVPMAVFQAASAASRAASQPTSSASPPPAVGVGAGTLSSPTVSAGSPVTLSFAVQGPPLGSLVWTIYQAVDANNGRSIGTFELDPAATSTSWDGTALWLSDGTTTTLLDAHPVLPGGTLLSADVRLTIQGTLVNGCVLVQLDSQGQPVLRGVHSLGTDPRDGASSLFQLGPSDLAGATLETLETLVDGAGAQLGQFAGDTLRASSLEVSRAPVPAGAYQLAVTGMDGLGGLSQTSQPVTVR